MNILKALYKWCVPYIKLEIDDGADDSVYERILERAPDFRYYTYTIRFDHSRDIWSWPWEKK